MGESIQEWTKQNRPYLFKFFKGCLPQILFGPFLNTFFHIPGHSNGNEPESRSFKIAARCCLKIKERESAERAFSHFQSFSRKFMQAKLIF